MRTLYSFYHLGKLHSLFEHVIDIFSGLLHGLYVLFYKGICIQVRPPVMRGKYVFDLKLGKQLELLDDVIGSVDGRASRRG